MSAEPPARPWLQHAPNSGFDLRAGSRLLQRIADNMLSVCLGLAGAIILMLAALGVTLL
jgi:hypothetical protein